MSRRSRQSRRGQKYSAAPGDLRSKGRSGPVRTVNITEAEAMAETLRFWGAHCDDCHAVTPTCYTVDHAIRLDAQSPIEGLRPMLRTIRRELGPECVVILCSCGSVGAVVRDWDIPAARQPAWKHL